MCVANLHISCLLYTSDAADDLLCVDLGGRRIINKNNDAVVTILEKGQLGETYLIGADGEMNNRQIVAMLLELMGKPADWFDLVSDRPGHDMRYAIDSSKLRAETGWSPKYQDIRAGLTQTIQWYRDHESWWAPTKARTEQTYRRLGR